MPGEERQQRIAAAEAHAEQLESRMVDTMLEAWRMACETYPDAPGQRRQAMVLAMQANDSHEETAVYATVVTIALAAARAREAQSYG